MKNGKAYIVTSGGDSVETDEDGFCYELPEGAIVLKVCNKEGYELVLYNNQLIKLDDWSIDFIEVPKDIDEKIGSLYSANEKRKERNKQMRKSSKKKNLERFAKEIGKL